MSSWSRGKLTVSFLLASVLSVACGSIDSNGERETMNGGAADGLGGVGSSTISVCGPRDLEETVAESMERLGSCTELVEVIAGHNDARDTLRVNIVFSGVGFVRYEDFRVLAEESVGCSVEDIGVLTLEPLRSHANRFNFWMTRNIGTVASFEAGPDHHGYEASDFVYEARDICDLSNTVSVGLVDWDFRSNADFSPFHWLDIDNIEVRALRTSQSRYRNMSVDECQDIVDDGCGDERLCEALGSIYLDERKRTGDSDWHLCKIVASKYSTFGAVFLSTHAGKFALAHELGHALFGLYDEVGEGSSGASSELDDICAHPNNCIVAASVDDPATSGTPAMAVAPGCGGVTQAHGLVSLRSQEETVMRSSSNGRFGKYDSRRVQRILDIVTRADLGR